MSGLSEWRILQGDCREVLRSLEADSIDACVTDPPYGIGFMAKEWDVPGGIGGFPMRRRVEVDATNTGVTRQGGRQRSCEDFAKRQKRDAHVYEADTEAWATEVYRVLKPGAYLLAFGGTRMFHRMTSGIEDAGFEVRDCLSWLYGSGFPKSLNLPGGLGTALKPGWEPIVMARKPLVGTVAANVEQFGTGAINVDACRLNGTVEDWPEKRSYSRFDPGSCIKERTPVGSVPSGRWPPNVLLDEDTAAMLDASVPPSMSRIGKPRASLVPGAGWAMTATGTEYEDQGGPSRFFYTAKPDREERDYGCESIQRKTAGEYTNRTDGSAGLNHPRAGAGHGGGRNSHPTVKPVALMRWLVRLVTPPGGTVLDPFLGSGTTGMACRYEMRGFIGIEREADYIAIAKARISAVAPLFSSEATA